MKNEVRLHYDRKYILWGWLVDNVRCGRKRKVKVDSKISDCSNEVNYISIFLKQRRVWEEFMGGNQALCFRYVKFRCWLDIWGRCYIVIVYISLAFNGEGWVEGENMGIINA